MSQERPTDDQESRLPDAGPDESVGPARPIRPEGGDDDPAQSPPTPTSPPGEHVGPAQPMDPARRQASTAGGPGAETARRDPAPDTEAFGDEPEPAARPPAPRPSGRGSSSRRTRAASARGAVDRVRRADFAVVLRGYDRAAVDAYVADVAQLVAELEATQLPETVVQRALDEVGDETSAILKRAHEAGEEIASRSRSQAESRLQRADREAELTRKEAEDQVRKLEDDIQNVWQERQRLIEDIRTLADDVLALADDAMERMPAPDEQAEDRAASSRPEGEGAQMAAEAPRPLTPASEEDRDVAEDESAGEDEGTGTGPPPLGLAPEPPSRDAFAEEVEGPDDVTAEHRLDDEETAERPPGSSGA
jgi:DivIVA domain-containing protein